MKYAILAVAISFLPVVVSAQERSLDFVCNATYPKAAAENQVSGEATIECTFTEQHRLASCIIISESNMRYGFGKATVKYFEKCAVVRDDQSPDTAAGMKKKFTYKWIIH